MRSHLTFNLDSDDQTRISQRSEIEIRILGSFSTEIQVEKSFQTFQTTQSPRQETLHPVSSGSTYVEGEFNTLK